MFLAMALFFWQLCFLSLLRISEAVDEAVVLVVDPSWDDVDVYCEKIPLLKRFKVIKVMTRRGKSRSFSGAGPTDLYRSFTYDSDTANISSSVEEFCPKLKSLPVRIAAVMPTSDPSVELTDRLAACLGVRGNPAFGPLARARRNKWVMGEAAKKAGLRTMREKLVSSWDEASAYLQSLPVPVSHKHPVIFKILNGVAGQGVMKVNSFSEAHDIFKREHGSEAQLGGRDMQILIQEYLVGKEYAVDTVSRDGVHKVIAVWFEDFRPANGIFDQYYGFKLLDPKDDFTKVIIEYANKVLDATGLYNGAANTEVKFLEEENQVCLVEINARWAGIGWHDGIAVEKATVGQDQYTAAFDAYLDADAFDKMPAVLPLRQHGAVIFTVNTHAGILKGLPGVAAAKESSSYLDSYVEHRLVGIGKYIAKTTPDTCPVYVALAHKSEAVVDKDYHHLIHLEKENTFFDVKKGKHGEFLVATLDGEGHIADSWSLGFICLVLFVGAASAFAVSRARASHRHACDDAVYLAIN
jgi:hypothetical protein